MKGGLSNGMKIYTKKGDKGKTSLFDGTIVPKSNIRVDSYGSIDELNSLLGVCSAFIKDKRIRLEIEKIQNDLLDIGSALAMPHALPAEGIPERTLEFEALIDKLTAKLPKLANFILPSGSKGGSLLHLARAVCRRVERRIAELASKQKIDPEILVYINRLSDLLFTLARFENYKQKPFGKLRASEKIWRKK
jgi:cob(I)alamin adenosyltransferase